MVNLEGLDAHPKNRGTLCPKGTAQIAAVYDPQRIKTPLIRTNGKGGPGEFRAASWNEALDLVAAKTKPVLEEEPKLLLSPCAVALDIDDNCDRPLQLLGDNQARDVLERGQGLTPSADQDSQVISVDIYQQRLDPGIRIFFPPPGAYFSLEAQSLN